MHHYKKLEVWKKAMDLSVKVYGLTETFPEKEKFGLVSQLRRASVSVASNIAEGAGRNTQKDFSRFLSISQGSVFEVETQILLSERLGLIDSSESLTLIEEINAVSKMLNALKKSIESKY